jgi:hypothetical protein
MNNEHWLRWSPRPLAMMVAVITLLYSGIGVSLLNGILVSFKGVAAFAAVDPVTQNNLLYILLGIGAMRSYDKSKVSNS